MALKVEAKKIFRFLLVIILIVAIVYVATTEHRISDLYNMVTKKPQTKNVLFSDLGDKIQFFGDSITLGFRVPITERWTALVCNTLKSTEYNYGVSGDQWLDASPNIYNHHIAGRSTFLAYGVNDVARGQVYFDEMKRSIYAFTLYCSLPSRCIVNARDATLSSNGWENTTAYSSVGVMTANATSSLFPNSPTISANVYGRYIGFASTVVNTGDASDHFALSIAVDTKSVVDAPLPFFMTQLTAANGGSFCPYLWIYDAGNVGTHTIQITPVVVGNYSDRAFCDYFFGFDRLQADSSPVLLMQPTSFDYHLYDTTRSPPAGSVVQMTSYMKMLRTVAKDLASTYGLPIEVITEPLPYDLGNISHDLVHPLQKGHAFIANHVLKMLDFPY